MITQAITTKYLAPTNTKGSRVKASCGSTSVTIGWDHALNPAENHAAAADTLRAKLGWWGDYVQGSLPIGDGYAFVAVHHR